MLAGSFELMADIPMVHNLYRDEQSVVKTSTGHMNSIEYDELSKVKSQLSCHHYLYVITS